MRKYTKVEMDRLLRNNGFTFVRQSGGHCIYKRDGETAVLTRNIQEPIALRLIKEHHLVTTKKGKKIVDKIKEG